MYPESARVAKSGTVRGEAARRAEAGGGSRGGYCAAMIANSARPISEVPVTLTCSPQVPTAAAMAVTPRSCGKESRDCRCPGSDRWWACRWCRWPQTNPGRRRRLAADAQLGRVVHRATDRDRAIAGIKIALWYDGVGAREVDRRKTQPRAGCDR